MREIHSIYLVAGLLILLAMAAGCRSTNSSPKALLNRYFTSAINQDYGRTYDCYYTPYRAKVSKTEYIRHRKEASVLRAFRIVSLHQKDNEARAEVLLTFAPSRKLHREKPVSTIVTEDMVKEAGEWKIRVWD